MTFVAVTVETSGRVQVTRLSFRPHAMEMKPEQSARYGPPTALSFQASDWLYGTALLIQSCARAMICSWVIAPPSSAGPRLPVEVAEPTGTVPANASPVGISTAIAPSNDAAAMAATPRFLGVEDIAFLRWSTCSADQRVPAGLASKFVSSDSTFGSCCASYGAAAGDPLASSSKCRTSTRVPCAAR